MVTIRRAIALPDVEQSAEEKRAERVIALRARRLARARVSLKRWTTRLKRAKTAVTKLERKVAYYERLGLK